MNHSSEFLPKNPETVELLTGEVPTAELMH